MSLFIVVIVYVNVVKKPPSRASGMLTPGLPHRTRYWPHVTSYA